MPRLEAPVEIGGMRVPNRLYRAPLLECAGNGEDAVDRLIQDLEPAAASGVGLVCQGATIVRGEGGCAAPNMTRVHDPAFVSTLERLTDAIHDHGSRIVLQLEHGGLRSMETWHAGYRSEHPDLQQLAVSRIPRPLRVADRTGFLDYDPHVLSTAEVRELARDFGRAGGYAADAGYDGIHLAGANMGIVQQFLSPFYNRRNDEFGGSLRNRIRFVELVYREIRRRTDLPVMTKVPVETPSPAFVRRYLSTDDGVKIAARLSDVGFDALVPVKTSVFWDTSIVRGAFPERAWIDEGLQDDYAAAFGSRWRARLVRELNRLHATEFEPGWNADLCRRVRERVDVPVLCEGGIRDRPQIDRLLGAARDDAPDGEARAAGVAGSHTGYDGGDTGVDGDGAGSDGGDIGDIGDVGYTDYMTYIGDVGDIGDIGDTGGAPACDMVGMARPFYAEPRLAARLLHDREAAVVCENCNNCTVPQVAGEPGICRTPEVLRERGRLREAGAYDLEADTDDPKAGTDGPEADADGTDD